MFKIKVNPDFCLDKAVEVLELNGVQVFWASEDEAGSKEIIVDDIEGEWPFIDNMEGYEYQSINWEKEWREFAPDIMDGIHIGSKLIKMSPGPGFGNLSHPTTVLMLDLMEGVVEGKVVVDVGTGSGILALAAKAMGAKEVWAIDIDEEAVLHAKQNSELNHLEVKFGCPDTGDIYLMNMILSEQKEVLKTLIPQGQIIVSGIIDAKEYLHFAESLGWTLLNTKDEEGWYAFHFSIPDEA